LLDLDLLICLGVLCVLEDGELCIGSLVEDCKVVDGAFGNHENETADHLDKTAVAVELTVHRVIDRVVKECKKWKIRCKFLDGLLFILFVGYLLN
jgi:hypothetical protein